MTDHVVRVTASGPTAKVLIDDFDVSEVATSVTITIDAHRTPMVTLTLIPDVLDLDTVAELWMSRPVVVRPA